MTHSTNIAIHVVAGTIALIIGFFIIFYRKGTPKHRRLGNIFLFLLFVVVTTGLIGSIFFRTNSFLLMLTILAGYTGYSGFRNVKLREERSTTGDTIIATGALLAGVLYMTWLNNSNSSWNPSVVYPTLFGLILVTVYDLLKRFWFHSQTRSWWLYEHIYKILSAHSALFSGFVGNAFPEYKPYSQMGPSILSTWIIIYFIIQQARLRSRNSKAGILVTDI